MRSPCVALSHLNLLRDNGVLRTFLSLYLSCTKQLHPSLSQKMGLDFFQIPMFFIVIALINTLLGWRIQGEY